MKKLYKKTKRRLCAHSSDFRTREQNERSIHGMAQRILRSAPSQEFLTLRAHKFLRASKRIVMKRIARKHGKVRRLPADISGELLIQPDKAPIRIGARPQRGNSRVTSWDRHRPGYFRPDD